MNRRELLERVQARIHRTEVRVGRLERWLKWTRCRSAVEYAKRTAVESLIAWRALQRTLIQTYKLAKDRKGQR